MSDDHYNDYPIFRGLQRPLEFMGIQGRYIYWAAATAGGSILGFIIGYCLFGFLVGLVLLIVSLCTGGALILVKQQKGLHSKKEDKGVFILSRTTKM
jgi:hypothetical protein